MKKHYFKVVALSLILLLFGVGMVIAQQNNGNEDMIMAAYNKNTGALRIIWDGNLRPNEIPLSWNITGPKGDDGICSCPITLENYDDLLSRILSLEEELFLITHPGGDFVATTEILNYEDINLNILSDFTNFMSGILSKVILNYDNTTADLWITSKEVGFERIWLTNYPSEGIVEDDMEIAAIEVDVKGDGSMDIEIFPWTEGAFRNFSKLDLNLPDINSIEFYPQGVAMVNELTLNLLGSSFVFARSAGETNIVFTSNEGYEASIGIEIDNNRNITKFQINPADFTVECFEGAQVSCFDGPEGSLNIGLCQSGTATCVNGSWSGCEGQILPEEERCDGLDNNCNGTVDETWPELGEFCGSSGFYMCKADGSGTECLGEDFCTPNPCNRTSESTCSGYSETTTNSSQGVCTNLDNGYYCTYEDDVVTSCEEGQYCLEGTCVPL